MVTRRSDPSEELANATICVEPAVRPVTVPLVSTVAIDSSTDSQRAPVVPAIAASEALPPTARRAATATVNVVLPAGAATADVPVVVVPPVVDVVPPVVEVPSGTVRYADIDVGPIVDPSAAGVMRYCTKRGYVADVTVSVATVAGAGTSASPLTCAVAGSGRVGSVANGRKMTRCT